jgi:electron transfer flavoprotein alpha subunit
MREKLNIWVFGDHRNLPRDRLSLQVVAAARRLSGQKGKVSVVLLGHHVEQVAQDYVCYGAECVLLVDDPRLEDYRSDLFSEVIGDLIRKEQPHVFLVGSSDFGKEVAPRIARRIGVGLCADAVSLDWDHEGQRLLASSPAFGGTFLARIAWNEAQPYMATVSPGTCPERPYDPDAKGEIVKVENGLNGRDSKIKVISSVRESNRTAKLEEAKIVVAGGRGVKKSDGFNLIRDLALLLGGEVGATRPAVDAHWTSHDQLIGQTGRFIEPELLVTCGTSGAAQYTAAIKGSGTIVAINRDPNAPIFKMADWGIVADALSFLPVFITEVKGHVFREITDLYRAQVHGKGQGAISFGQRIGKLRRDHKMSLVDLAEKTGQTPEFIEEVESDRLTPPVSFLLQLSQALHIDPSNFLTEQEKIKINGKRQEGFVKRTQNYSYRTLTPGAQDKHLRAFMITIDPREYHKMVEYKHPGEEFIFVYCGELEITLGNKIQHLKPGETIHFDSETNHKLRNVSDEKCELIVCLYTP